MTILGQILAALTVISFVINVVQFWRELLRNASERHRIAKLQSRLNSLDWKLTDCMAHADAIVQIGKNDTASKRELEEHVRLLRESLIRAQLELHGQQEGLKRWAYEKISSVKRRSAQGQKSSSGS